MCLNGFTLWIYLIVRIQKVKDDAWVAYQSSLKAVRLEPANANLKRKALALWRAYMNLSWLNRGYELYTEVAIINDIYAACAAAAPSQAFDAALDHVRSIAKRLATIDTLYKQPTISKAEYLERRREILEKL